MTTNQRAALHIIDRRQGVSREELGVELHVSATTAGRLIRGLLATGVVESRAETLRRHKAGRPRQLLILTSHRGGELQNF